MQHHACKFESMTVTAQYTVAMQLATWDKSEMRDWNVARWLAAFLSLLKQVVWQTYALSASTQRAEVKPRTNKSQKYCSFADISATDRINNPSRMHRGL